VTDRPTHSTQPSIGAHLLPKRPADTVATMTQYVLPQQANALGTVFGGQILAWIDLCAAIVAERHTGSAVVTVGMDDVSFDRSVRVGQVVLLEARVTAAFRTSLEVLVRVWGEDTRTQERWPTVEAFATFVAVDDHKQPRLIPPLACDTDEERDLERAAAERRATRLARRRPRPAV
jgi:acyl-CoA hydrolase